jgi:N-acetyl-anhydromuramyl-L-alanine amidase AmpD
MKDYGRKINKIVIHCTASRLNASVKQILDYFKNSKGWRSPGYHIIIDAEGFIHMVHPFGKVSNGVKGKNANLLNIALIGGRKGVFDFTNNQMMSLQVCLNQIRSEDQLGALPVVGHRDLSPDKNGDGIIQRNEWLKLCPSFDVKKWTNEVGIV